MEPTITVNAKWIILLGLILLVGSNYLTWISRGHISQKTEEVLEAKFDSLGNVIALKNLVHAQVVRNLKSIKEKDSVLILKLQELQQKDKLLLAQQNLDLAKYSKQSSHKLIFTLDSAYNAEVKNSK